MGSPDEAAIAIRARRTRAVVGILACVALPGLSWLDGSGTFAWTMFSATREFRIELVAIDPAGRVQPRNPTALAAHAAPGVASLLAGSDHWRPGASMGMLRAHLDDLALHACREEPAATVIVTLHERSRGAELATTRRVDCPP